MAKTLAQIQTQIDKLTRQADALLAKEVAEVIGRIRVAIAHYNLSADDLFGKGGVAGKRPAVKTTREAVTGKKVMGAPRYRDGEGRAWSGRGKRPNWFKDAIASGKTVQELEVQE